MMKGNEDERSEGGFDTRRSRQTRATTSSVFSRFQFSASFCFFASLRLRPSLSSPHAQHVASRRTHPPPQRLEPRNKPGTMNEAEVDRQINQVHKLTDLSFPREMRDPKKLERPVPSLVWCRAPCVAGGVKEKKKCQKTETRSLSSLLSCTFPLRFHRWCSSSSRRLRRRRTRFASRLRR